VSAGADSKSVSHLKGSEVKIEEKIERGDYNCVSPDLKRRKEKVEEFKEDLILHLEIGAHPKRKKLIEIAWELGHSYGYLEVLD